MIKTALIIPIYKQKIYWKRMLSMIERMWMQPSCIYVMLDRQPISDYNYIKKLCDDSDDSYLFKVFNMTDVPEYVGRPNHLPDQDLFLTGYRRNQAIDMAIEDGCDNFIFIDGDCLPQKDLILGHFNSNNKNIPVMSIGRRREAKYTWKDQRDITPIGKEFGLFNSVPEQHITDLDLLKTSAITWSCNMSLNLRAINLLKGFNEHYYGRSEVFNSNFLGTWGGEDGFIGIEAHLCNIFIVLINEKESGIKHIEHDRPVNKYSGEAFNIYLDDQIDLLNIMMRNSPLTLDFFTT